MRKICAILAVAALFASASCSKMKNEIADLKAQVEQLSSFKIIIDNSYPSDLDAARTGELNFPYTIEGAGDEKVTVNAYFITPTRGRGASVVALPSDNTHGILNVCQGTTLEGWDDVCFAVIREGSLVAIEAITESGRCAKQIINAHESYFTLECVYGSYDAATKTRTIKLEKNAYTKEVLGMYGHDIFEYFTCDGTFDGGLPHYYCSCFENHAVDWQISDVVKLVYKSGDQFIEFSTDEPVVDHGSDFWERYCNLAFSCPANTTSSNKGEIFEVRLDRGRYGSFVLGYIKFIQNN